MFASVRCYFVHRVPTMELVQRVAEDFAVQIAARAGFVSYEFIDGGGGDAVSISVFRDAADAEASRDLARRWTEQRLQDLELTITESLHGKIVISRAAREIATLAPEGHVGHYVRLRRYRVAAADVDRLLRRVDASFVDRAAAVDGFLGYRLIDCGSGELLSSSLFRDGTSAAALDELAARFLAEEVGDIRVDRTDIVGGGPVVVSRVTDALLARVDV
jgi:predicted lipid carrier protein YhbT